MTEIIQKKSVEINKKSKKLSVPLIATLSSYILCVLMFSFLGNFEYIFNKENYLKYNVGDVVKDDIYSTSEIYLIDEISTDRKKELAESLAFPVFKIYDDITRDVIVEFDDFVTGISEYQKNNLGINPDSDFAGKLPDLIQTDQFTEIFNDPLLFQNLTKTRNIVQNIMNSGIIFTDDSIEIPPTGIIEIWREMGNDFDHAIVKYNQVPRKDTISLYIRNELKSHDLTFTELKTIEVFATFFIRENCFYDDFQSRLNRDEAASKVQPVEIIIRKGELVLEKGLVVTPELEIQLKAIQNAKGERDLFSILSPFIFAALLFTFGIIYFNIFAPKIASNTQLDILFYVILTVSILITYLIILFTATSVNLSNIVFIPVALFSMLVTLLADKKSGLIFQLIVSLTIFYISRFNLEFFLVALFSGISGCLVIEGAEKRIDIIRAGLIQGVAQAVIFVMIQFIVGSDGYVLIWETIVIFVNGFVCGILALGLLPVLEHWMKSSTRFRLFELSDSNAPVLKNMLAKAPGTYIHSMNVANLAEMACQEIGANSLLARVGGLYHDIGKVDQSEYFIENQTDVNKHDDMKPSLSAAVLKAHVKIGIEKGHDLNLPKEVIDIIAEHHATSTMKYFYDRAKNEKGNTKINKEDFSYSGPNPQTREAAVVMLADTIEAATRTLKKPSLAKLEKYVWELIMDKFINGELNACSLTFKDMEFVKTSFVHVLAGHFHTRIEYPDEQKNREKELLIE